MKTLQTRGRFRSWLALLVIFGSLCLPGMFPFRSAASAGLVAQLDPATATATLTPTITLTPTPTATLSALVTDLKRQLVFGIGGGNLPPCQMAAQNITRWPAVAYERANFAHSDDKVCLFGFKKGDSLIVKLLDPSNRLAASISMFISEDNLAAIDFSIHTLSLPSLPFFAPIGPWRLEVSGASGKTSATYWNPLSQRDFTLSRSVQPGKSWYDVHRVPLFAQGDTLLVSGVHYEKEKIIPVAIYRDEGRLNLAATQMVRTNRLGRFTAGFPIDERIKPGLYYVVVDPDLTQDSVGMRIAKYSFAVVTPLAVCPGGIPSLLALDRLAMVTPGTPIRLYEDTSLSSRVIGTIAEYDTVEVTGGPYCAGGLVWWKVLSHNTGLGGYTLEGRDGAYWLRRL